MEKLTEDEVREWISGALQVAHCAPHELEGDEELEALREKMEDVRLMDQKCPWVLLVEAEGGPTYRVVFTVTKVD
jgi:hypothetical protein